MKKFLMSCASVALLANSVAAEEKCTTSTVNYEEAVTIQDPSTDNNDQMYMGFGIMGNKMRDTVIRVPGFAGDIDPKLGLGFAVTVGKEFGPNWRAEIEGAWRKNAIDEFNTVGGNLYNPTPGGASSGNVQAWSLMANALRDFKVSDRTEMYLGGGFGIARLGYRSLTTGGLQLIKDYDTSVVGQGILGFNRHLSENTSLDVSYRYLFASRSDVSMPKNRTGSPSYRAHSLMATLRYTFGERQTTPAPRTVMEQRTREETECVTIEKPVVVNPDPFLVLFNFDSAELTPEAKAIIANAVEAFNEYGMAAISVVGHTDSAGAASYNQNLAAKRAMAVKTELAGLGISMDTVSTSSKGESEPLIATGDNVREPQNRRAEIILSR